MHVPLMDCPESYAAGLLDSSTGDISMRYQRFIVLTRGTQSDMIQTPGSGTQPQRSTVVLPLIYFSKILALFVGRGHRARFLIVGRRHRGKRPVLFLLCGGRTSLPNSPWPVRVTNTRCLEPGDVDRGEQMSPK